MKRVCKYCDNTYETKEKHSHVCDECKLRIFKERYTKRVYRIKLIEICPSLIPFKNAR